MSFETKTQVREAAMRKSSWLLLALVLSSIEPSSANAAALHWISGADDVELDPSTASTCTLIVVRDPQLTAVDGVRLIWEGDGRLKFATSTATAQYNWSANSVASPSDLADAASGRESLDLGVTANTQDITLIVTVESGNYFALTAVETEAGRALRWPIDTQSSASINGGIGPILKPEIISTDIQAVADSVQFWVHGIGLSHAAIARLLTTIGQSVPLTIRTFGDTTLLCACASTLAANGRRLYVSDGHGAGSEIEADTRAVLSSGQPKIVAILSSNAPSTALNGITGVASYEPVDPSPQPLDNGDVSARTPDLSKVIVLDVSPSSQAGAVLGDVRANSYVLSADTTSEGPQPMLSPNDPLWREQWGLHDLTDSHCSGTINPVLDSSIHSSDAWNFPPYPQRPYVGILDGGINELAPDFHSFLDSLVLLGHSSATTQSGTPTDPWTDITNHGSAVASIAMAPMNNGIGLAGASLGAIPVSIKWYDEDPVTGALEGGTWPAVIADIVWAAQHDSVSIVNMSLGGTTIDPTDLSALRSACKLAFDHHILLVAAAGNQHSSAGTFPAILDTFCLSVGATLWNNAYWTNANATPLSSDSLVGSAFGPWLDLTAPGGLGIAAVWSTGSENFYWSIDNYNQTITPCDINPSNLFDPSQGGVGFGGTSAAAPFVSGTAALLLRLQPTLTAEDLAQVMERTATDLGAVGRDIYYGFGRVDAVKGAEFVSSNWIEHGTVGPGGSGSLAIGSDSATTTITLNNVPGLPSGAYPCVRYHLSGLGFYSTGVFTQPPAVWVRFADTVGLPNVARWDFDSELDWAEVANQGNQNWALFDTYVYRLTSMGNQFYPCDPSKAQIAYTAIGPSRTVSVSQGPRQAAALAVRTHVSPARVRASFDVTGIVSGPLRVELFDVIGRKVQTLFEGASSGGQASFDWDGRARSGRVCSAGMYILRVEQPARRAACKFVLIR